MANVLKLEDDETDLMETVQRHHTSPALQGRAPGSKVKRGTTVQPKVEEHHPRVRSPTPQKRVKKEAKVKAGNKLAKVKGKPKRNGPKHLFDDEFRTLRFERAGVPDEPFSVEIDQATRDKGAVPRYFMSDTYGGNPNIVFPEPCAEKLAEHGYRDFMFLAYDRQPEAPRLPGKHGLWLQLGVGEAPPWEGGIARLLTRVQDKPALWQYQGQYEIEASINMTKGEWGRQSTEVRMKWIGDFHARGDIRARAYHRRLHPGTEPTEDEVDDILKNKHDESVTREEVALAFTRGEFTLMVYTMKCIGYDADFQREVIAKHSTWIPKRLRT